jgi:hypothetical protein
MQRQICKLLAQGHTVATVCEAVGISEWSYYHWQKKPKFSQATTRAIGESKVFLVEKLRHADDWRAQAFLLERRWPNEYGKVAERALPDVLAEPKRPSIAIVLNTGGKSLEELANFPVVGEQPALPKAEPNERVNGADELDGNAAD